MRNQINIVKANIKTMEVETRDDTKILKMTVYLSINFQMIKETNLESIVVVMIKRARNNTNDQIIK